MKDEYPELMCVLTRGTDHDSIMVSAPLWSSRGQLRAMHCMIPITWCVFHGSVGVCLLCLCFSEVATRQSKRSFCATSVMRGFCRS